MREDWRHRMPGHLLRLPFRAQDRRVAYHLGFGNYPESILGSRTTDGSLANQLANGDVVDSDDARRLGDAKQLLFHWLLHRDRCLSVMNRSGGGTRDGADHGEGRR